MIKKGILTASLLANLGLVGYINSSNETQKIIDSNINYFLNKVGIIIDEGFETSKEKGKQIYHNLGEKINGIHDIEDNFKIKDKVNSIIEEPVDNLNNNINDFVSIDEDRNGDYLGEILEKKGFSIDTLELLNKVYFEYLKGEYFLYNGIKIHFTEEFINDNKDYLNNNLKKFIIFIMNIESNGGFIYAQNPVSSAKGPLQFLDGYIKGKKHNYYSRKKGIYTSFETALRRTDSFYNNGNFTEFQSENTPKYIKEAWNNDGRLDFDKIDGDKQINLWITDSVMRSKHSRKLLMGIMLGSYWSAKKMYRSIHHTSPDEGTQNLINIAMKDLSFDKIIM